MRGFAHQLHVCVDDGRRHSDVFLLHSGPDWIRHSMTNPVAHTDREDARLKTAIITLEVTPGASFSPPAAALVSRKTAPKNVAPAGIGFRYELRSRGTVLYCGTGRDPFRSTYEYLPSTGESRQLGSRRRELRQSVRIRLVVPREAFDAADQLVVYSAETALVNGLSVSDPIVDTKLDPREALTLGQGRK